jgi:isopenicillin-N epimerase
MLTKSSPASDFLLDSSITFLNHGSFGSTPRPVFEEYQKIQLQLENEPVEFLGRQASSMLQQARQVLADYLHAGRDDLVFVPNATHGVNIIARSLELGPGDEVLTTDHEYGAMDRTWQFLSGKKGFIYRVSNVTLPVTSAESFINELFSQVNAATKVIYLSHITSPTALIFPIKEVCKKARQMNILTVIDGAHAPGQIELDLGSIGPDFYTGNCHKWLCAPKGSAFLYARPEVQHLVEPLVVSWGWHPEQPGTSPFIDLLEWSGTRDISPFLSVPIAVEYQRYYHWDKIRSTCHDKAAWINREITALFGTNSLSSSSAWFGQMVSVPLPDAIPPVDLQQILLSEYQIEVPIIRWKDMTLIRVSVQVYNDLNDLQLLLYAFRRIYDQG